MQIIKIRNQLVLLSLKILQLLTHTSFTEQFYYTFFYNKNFNFWYSFGQVYKNQFQCFNHFCRFFFHKQNLLYFYWFKQWVNVVLNNIYKIKTNVFHKTCQYLIKNPVCAFSKKYLAISLYRLSHNKVWQIIKPVVDS